MTSADQPSSPAFPGVVRLSAKDNVAVATRKINRGESIDCSDLQVSPRCDIPPGHKIAIQAIAAGSPISKYGQPIGLASTTIQPGDHVHQPQFERPSRRLG